MTRALASDVFELFAIGAFVAAVAMSAMAVHAV